MRQNVCSKDMNVQVQQRTPGESKFSPRTSLVMEELSWQSMSLRRVLTAQGEAQPHAADWDEKENTYPELL